MERSPEPLPKRRYESPLHLTWEIKDPVKFTELQDIISEQHKFLTTPPAVFRGGGVLAPTSKDLALPYRHFLASERPFVVLPVTSEAGGKLTDVVHFPTSTEELRFDANLAAYKQHLGDYVSSHWSQEGMSPIPKATNFTTLPDGRYVTSEEYRGYTKGIGKGPGALGIHELDIQHNTPDDMRSIVRTLSSATPSSADFYSWVRENNRVLPKESLLNPDNPRTALRGQEWWSSSDTTQETRSQELAKQLKPLEKDFRAIDPAMDPHQKIATLIENNAQIFLHQNGKAERPELVAEPVIVHGALYPDNIQLSRQRGAQNPDVTILGGDRAHQGVRGEMIDWLVTAAAESPMHQKAMIEEFLTLHPSESDRRGLAMHVLYRSLKEAPWFAKHKPVAYQNLIKLSYDILEGNGVWNGVNTPYSAK